jgi:hypothetical protein
VHQVGARPLKQQDCAFFAFDQLRDVSGSNNTMPFVIADVAAAREYERRNRDH